MKSKERFSKESFKIPGRYVCHENKELQLLKCIEFQTNGQYKYILEWKGTNNFRQIKSKYLCDLLSYNFYALFYTIFFKAKL